MRKFIAVIVLLLLAPLAQAAEMNLGYFKQIHSSTEFDNRGIARIYVLAAGTMWVATQHSFYSDDQELLTVIDSCANRYLPDNLVHLLMSLPDVRDDVLIVHLIMEINLECITEELVSDEN